MCPKAPGGQVGMGQSLPTSWEAGFSWVLLVPLGSKSFRDLGCLSTGGPTRSPALHSSSQGHHSQRERMITPLTNEEIRLRRVTESCLKGCGYKPTRTGLDQGVWPRKPQGSPDSIPYLPTIKTASMVPHTPLAGGNSALHVW